MFQFSGFPPYDYGFIIRYMESVHVGFPIRISADQRLCAAPRSFSQLVTSFFGSQCQGIHPALFLLNRFTLSLAYDKVAFFWFSFLYFQVLRCLPIQRDLFLDLVSSRYSVFIVRGMHQAFLQVLEELHPVFCWT